MRLQALYMCGLCLCAVCQFDPVLVCVGVQCHTNSLLMTLFSVERQG